MSLSCVWDTTLTRDDKQTQPCLTLLLLLCHQQS